MGRKKGNKKPKLDDRTPPTPEAARHGIYQSYFAEGTAKYRRVPVIETMLNRHQISDGEYAALAHYRDQAELAERSPVKSCLDQSIGGGGDIPVPAAITSAILTVARIERELGSLLDICRAVAVDDKSLSQWCIEQFGGRERYDGNGRFVAVVPINERRHMEIATIDLRMGARRIMSA